MEYEEETTEQYEYVDEKVVNDDSVAIVLPTLTIQPLITPQDNTDG